MLVFPPPCLLLDQVCRCNLQRSCLQIATECITTAIMERSRPGVVTVEFPQPSACSMGQKNKGVLNLAVVVPTVEVIDFAEKGGGEQGLIMMHSISPPLFWLEIARTASGYEKKEMVSSTRYTITEPWEFSEICPPGLDESRMYGGKLKRI
jgi:hypothetical protein